MRDYELVIVWESGEKAVYTYESKAEAEKARDGYIKVFGRQLWACVREKRG